MNYLPLRVQAKNILKKLLPLSVFKLIVILWRNSFSHLISDTGVIQKYTDDFIKKHGYTVMGGPFVSMNYVEEAAGSSYLIKLIGVYEEVLHPMIEKIKKSNYSTIIDIGCAEGYYLIGLGKSLPTSRLVGYDIDNKALSLTKKLYEINNLSNELLLIDNCTPRSLAHHIDDKTLLICDAEGFEYDILNPSQTPELTTIKTFLIELHDFVVPDIKKILTDRFESSHTIQVIQFKNGTASNYPYLRDMESKEDLYAILRERGEQEQEWLVMERKDTF